MSKRFELSNWRIAGILIIGVSYTVGILYVAKQVDQSTFYLGHLVGVVVAFLLYLADLLYHHIKEVQVEELFAFVILSFIWEATLLMLIMGSFILAPKSANADGSKIL